MQEQLSEQPVLLLDDIFSELDEGHMRHLLSVVGNQQTIITTTHKEFLEEAKAVNPHVIELKK
jgi:DNA replication and repair protein RecF